MKSYDRGARGKPSSERRAAIDLVILDYAKNCFSEKGFAKTSMEEIALQLGLSKHTVYRRHPNKVALLNSVLSKDVDDSHEDLFLDHAEGVSTRESMRLLLRMYVDRELRRLSSSMYRKVAAEASVLDEIAVLMVSCAERAEEVVRSRIQKA